MTAAEFETLFVVFKMECTLFIFSHVGWLLCLLRCMQKASEQCTATLVHGIFVGRPESLVQKPFGATAQIMECGSISGATHGSYHGSGSSE